MKIAGVYTFKGGVEQIARHYPDLLTEVKAVIQAVDADTHKTKVSKEKSMSGRRLYSPSSLNKALKTEFSKHGWEKIKVYCEYPTTYYEEGYVAGLQSTTARKKIHNHTVRWILSKTHSASKCNSANMSSRLTTPAQK